jgi:hypothetical protein
MPRAKGMTRRAARARHFERRACGILMRVSSVSVKAREAVSVTTAAHGVWTIIAVAGDGGEARLEENPHSLLRHLLIQAVHRLYGAHVNADDYEIVIDGVAQTNLDISLEQAGLHNDAEVVVQPRDVSKG